MAINIGGLVNFILNEERGAERDLFRGDDVPGAADTPAQGKSSIAVCVDEAPRVSLILEKAFQEFWCILRIPLIIFAECLTLYRIWIRKYFLNYNWEIL